MDKARVERRKVELEGMLREALAGVHALQGAIRDCDYWLAELTKQTETQPN